MLQHGAWVCSPHCSPAYSQAQNQKEAPFIQSLTFPQRPHQCISSPNSKAKFHLVHQKKLLPSPPFTGAGTADSLQWRFFHPGTRWVTVFLEKLLSYFPPAYKRLRFCHLRVWGAIYSEVWGQKKKREKEGLVPWNIHSRIWSCLRSHSPSPHPKLPVSSPGGFTASGWNLSIFKPPIKMQTSPQENTLTSANILAGIGWQDRMHKPSPRWRQKLLLELGKDWRGQAGGDPKRGGGRYTGDLKSSLRSLANLYI